MVTNLVLNRHANKDREELLKIINSFEEKNLKDVLLACTDLQLLIPHHSTINIYDTMELLASATIDRILE